MNLKRLIATGAGAALLLSATAVPALAWDGNDGPFTLIKNWAKVKNVVNTSADTGGNAILAHDDVNGGSITTGVATAVSVVKNEVNTNVLDDPCLCEEDATLIIKNKAKVKNYVTTTADTGWNVISAGDDVTGGSIYTGDADATSVVENTVNTNIVGFVL